MDEKCSECSREFGSFETCLKCNNAVCYFCKEEHTRMKNHLFRFPLFYNSSYSRCKSHLYRSFENVCLTCGVMICESCLRETHGSHKIKSLKKVASQQQQHVQDELNEFEKSVIETQNQLKTREMQIDNFFDKARSLQHELKSDAERIDALIFERRHQLDCLEQPQLNGKLSVIFKENLSIKHSLNIRKILIKALKNLLESRNNSSGFVKSYAEYMDIYEKCVNLPASVSDESLQELQISYYKPKEEEINAVLPAIYIGKMAAQLHEHDGLKTREKSSSVHQEDKLNRELDLKREIKLWKNAVHEILDNAKQLSTECKQQNNEPVTIQLKHHTTYIPEIEEVISTFETQMQVVLNVINEKSAKIKQLKAGNFTDGVPTASIQDYRKKIQEKKDELEKMKLQLTEAQKGLTRNKGNDLERKQIQELQEWKYSLEQKLNLAKNQIEDRSKEIELLKGSLYKMDEESSKTKKELKAKMKDNEDLKTRLSQVAGAKLVAGNTNIADLGDKYRPTRIAELYSELYDNDWTEAVDKFSKQEWSEDIIVQHLFITLQGCYSACSQLAKKQLQDLVQNLSFGISSTDGITKFRESHTTEIRQLVDARKGTAVEVANSISKGLYKNQKFEEVLRSYKWMKDDIVRQITKLQFFEKCVTVCWLMVVQDPEMYIADDLRHGIKFDKDHYREYTKSGPKVHYSVWPALYLHKNGPLMIKGVAQACD